LSALNVAFRWKAAQAMKFAQAREEQQQKEKDRDADYDADGGDYEDNF
jgi:hypothetical protein